MGQFSKWLLHEDQKVRLPFRPCCEHCFCCLDCVVTLAAGRSKYAHPAGEEVLDV